MNSNDIPQDVSQRIQRLIDGELTADELAALEGEMMDSPEALETYRDFLDLHCALEEEINGERMVNTRTIIPIDRVLALQRRSAIKASLLGAAAVLLLAAVSLWHFQAPDKSHPLAEFQIAPGSDFTLTHSGEGDAPAGNTMAAGSRLVLLHGVAELNLPHDVRAVVEAPAEMVLRDDRTLELAHGRAFFQVASEDGRGFTVVTPHQRIVDLGTAFGIDAPKGWNEMELHVLEGRVRVDGKGGEHGEIIQATRAVTLAGTQVLREIENPSIGFRHKLPPKIETLLNEDFATGLLAGQNYVIRMDPTVIRDLDGKNFPGIDDDKTWNFTSLSNAAPAIITPTSEVATNQFGDWIDTIDGTGLSGGGTSGDILSETHAGSGSANFALFPSGSDFAGEAIIFTLGAPFTVNQVHLWLQHSATWGAISGFDLEFSTDGGRTFPTTVSGITFDLSLDLSKVQSRTFAEQAGVTHIRLSNVVVTGGDQSFAGFNEIRFGKPESSVDNRFSDWIALFPDVGDQTGFDDDPDGDRLSNGLEAQFGTHPGQWTPAPALGTSDDSPPVLIAAYPADDSTSASLGAQLKMLFNQPIKFGTGRVYIQNVTNWNESILVVGDRRLSIDDRVLTINPPVAIKDGTESSGWLAGWESRAPVTFLNPRGDGMWYDNGDLRDDRPTRGMIGSMRSPGMISINKTIRREVGAITPGSRYTVSAAIGVRADDAEAKSIFPGYTLRLVSGATTLAQLTGNTPPGPANGVSTVSFSWDATTLPDGIQPGDPLSIEIIPNRANGLTPGYLDLNAIRISVLGQAGKR